MSEDLLKWLAGLHPGDISAYAALVIVIVGGVYAIHKDNLVFGPRWRDKVAECSECKKDKDALAEALTKANEAMKAAEREETQRIIEIARLRMERELQWKSPSGQGTTQ